MDKWETRNREREIEIWKQGFRTKNTRSCLFDSFRHFSRSELDINFYAVCDNPIKLRPQKIEKHR